MVEQTYICTRCGNELCYRIDYKIQSSVVAKEGWTFTKKELTKMEAAWEKKQKEGEIRRKAIADRSVPGFKRKKKPCRGCLTPEAVAKVLQTREFHNFYTRQFDDYIAGQPEALDKEAILKYIEDIFY